MELSAVERRRVMKLDGKENAVRSSATSAAVELVFEPHRPLDYKSGVLRVGSVHSFFVKRRSSSSSMMTAESWNKNAGIPGNRL